MGLNKSIIFIEEFFIEWSLFLSFSLESWSIGKGDFVGIFRGIC